MHFLDMTSKQCQMAFEQTLRPVHSVLTQHVDVELFAGFGKAEKRE